MAGEDGEPFVYGTDGIDVELALANSVHYLLTEHQVPNVLNGDDDPLVAGETARLAEPEEAFDLGRGAADGLNLAVLVHRPGDGDPLLDGITRQTGEQRVELGG